MATLSEVRTAVADALGSAELGLTMHAHPVLSAPVPTHGWINVARLRPADFSGEAVDLAVVIILSGELRLAEERFDELAVPVLRTITDMGGGTDVTVEPVALTVGTGDTYALQATFTMEVTE